MHPYRTRTQRAAAVLLAAGWLLALPGAAHASHPPTPKTKLTLTLHEWSGDRSTHHTLECQPAGGTHPKPAAACQILQTVDGDWKELDLNAKECKKLDWNRVDARMEGTWRGRAVDSKPKVFNNKCALERATGAVFDWT